MDGFHPIRYVKAHPVGTIVCVGLGYWAGCRYGGSLPSLPFASAKVKVAAGADD